MPEKMAAQKVAAIPAVGNNNPKIRQDFREIFLWLEVPIIR